MMDGVCGLIINSDLCLAMSSCTYLLFFDTRVMHVVSNVISV